MLLIREDQMAKFDDYVVRRFEDYMLVHLLKIFGEYIDFLGENVARTIIRYGVKRGRAYGFNYKRCLRIYIDFMFILGSDYDVDPQLPWVAEILSDTEFASESERCDVLYDRVMEYSEKVIGPDALYLKQAVSRMVEAWGRESNCQQGSFTREYSIDQLNNLYPQKFQYLEDGYKIFNVGYERAKSYMIIRPCDQLVFVFCTLLFGSQFELDPQFRGAAKTLTDVKVVDQASTMKIFVNHMTSLVERRRI